MKGRAEVLAETRRGRWRTTGPVNTARGCVRPTRRSPIFSRTEARNRYALGREARIGVHCKCRARRSHFCPTRPWLRARWRPRLLENEHHERSAAN